MSRDYDNSSRRHVGHLHMSTGHLRRHRTVDDNVPQSDDATVTYMDYVGGRLHTNSRHHIQSTENRSMTGGRYYYDDNRSRYSHASDSVHESGDDLESRLAALRLCQTGFLHQHTETFASLQPDVNRQFYPQQRWKTNRAEETGDVKEDDCGWYLPYC